MTLIDYRPFFAKGCRQSGPVFYELSLHQQIIRAQQLGLTLEEIAIYLKKERAEIDASILAWLREK